MDELDDFVFFATAYGGEELSEIGSATADRFRIPMRSVCCVKSPGPWGMRTSTA